MTDCLEHLVPVVWTSKGPCLPDDFEYIRTNLRSRGTIQVWSLGRLPRMVDYVVPSGVTIAEAARVRLGAYLAPGTMVEREGYVSYNAGSLGPARIEGRLSSSVVLGEGTHVGLSAVLMAEADDRHNRTPLQIGRNSVLRPSSGVIGVDLGENCELGIGVMLEPGSALYDARTDQQIYARDIAGADNVVIQNDPSANLPVVKLRTEANA